MTRSLTATLVTQACYGGGSAKKWSFTVKSDVCGTEGSEQKVVARSVPRSAPGEAAAEWFVRRLSHLARTMAQEELERGKKEAEVE